MKHRLHLINLICSVKRPEKYVIIDVMLRDLLRPVMKNLALWWPFIFNEDDYNIADCDITASKGSQIDNN